MLIDFHTHAFPEKIADKAINNLSFVSGGLEYHTDGTAEGLKKRMRESGVDYAVMLSIATNAHQQRSVNDFAAAQNGKDGIIAFGSVFPDSEDALDELERIKELGLCGIKLHPDYQRFSVDDEKMKPIYKKVSELGLITVFHAGVDIAFPPPYGCTPDKLARALEWFSTPVVAAHWGGIGYYAETLEKLAGRDLLYFDISFGYGNIPKYYAEKIVEAQTADKLLFGTDTPWHTAEMEWRLLNTLGLSEQEIAKITYQNAQKLLGLEL